MQKIIDQITDQLIGLIKKDQEYYTPQQLLKAEIPSYIVERVRLVLEDKVQEDVSKPDSKWLISDNELLNHAWEDFRSSAISSTAVPHDDLYSVLHGIVSDIISVFVEPRKYMAAYLFREDEVLSFEEISHRCERLTIYKHFGTAIPLYMQKRDLEELSLERCQQLIKNLDARIVSGYSAEDWAKKLDLLFTLFGGKLDPNLLTLFFRDKGLENAASIFEQIDVPVTQSTFIQMLSEKKLDINTVSESVTKTPEPEAEDADQQNEVSLVDGFQSIEKEEEPGIKDLASAYQEEVPDEDVKDIIVDIASDGIVEADNTKEATSLNSLFGEDIGDDSEKTSELKPEDSETFKTNLTSILDQAKDSFEGVMSDSVKEDELIIEDEFIEDPVEESIEEEQEIEAKSEEIRNQEDSTDQEDEDQPMWAQFLSPDQMEVMMGTREEEETEPNLNEALDIDDDFGDSILEETSEEKEETVTEFETGPNKALEDVLSESRKTWVKKIFKGKKKAYDEAVEEISYFKNWEEASMFVQTDVFGEYNVDMFSEEAIAFIDALQTYFNEYKS